MRPLSESTARVSGKNFERKYITLGRIIKQWNLIVGDDLAHKAIPTRLHYRKYKKSKQAETLLEVAVSSAQSTILHYRKALILEKINNIFGENWIKDIKFTPLHDIHKNKYKKRGQTPLSEEDNLKISSAIENIEDDAIRERLLSLGKNIHTTE